MGGISTLVVSVNTHTLWLNYLVLMTWGLHFPVIAPCTKLQNNNWDEGSSLMPWE